MSDVFISYRRGPASPYARGIYEGLETHFGSERVFMDIDTMEPGVDFVDYIQSAVGSCRVLIVVISPEWVTVADDSGRRRLDNPDDFVRVEVAAALERRDVRVIPVLVGDAPPPARDDLPPDLAALTRRNALEITDGRWDYDIGVLVRTVTKVLGEEGPEPPERDPDPGRRPPASWKRPLLVAGAAAVLGVALVVLLLGGDDEGENAPAAQTLTTGEMDEALADYADAFGARDTAAIGRLASTARYTYLGARARPDYEGLFESLEPRDLQIRTLNRSLDGPTGVADISYTYRAVGPSTAFPCEEGWMNGGTARMSFRDAAIAGEPPDVRITRIDDRPHVNWATKAGPARTQVFKIRSREREALIARVTKEIPAGGHCLLLRLNSNADRLPPDHLVQVEGTVQYPGGAPEGWGPQPKYLQRGLG